MSKNPTAVIILLDRSGSMGSLRYAMIDSFNEFITEQRKTVNDDIFAMYGFSDECVEMLPFKNISEAKNLTIEDYQTGGMTKLYDSMSDVIDSAGEYFSSLPKSKQPKKVMFMIFTDGAENSSVKTSLSKLKEKMRHQEDKYSWDFSFIGTDFDVDAEASKINITRSNTLSFDKSAGGLEKAYVTASLGVTAYRTTDTKNLGFNSED